MKPFAKTFIIGAFCLGFALSVRAQSQDGDHFTIPLKDASRPATVNVNAFSGSISVKGYDGNDIIVDIKYRGRKIQPVHSDVDTTGLKRIASSVPMIEEEDNTLRISTGMSNVAELAIQVPRHTILVLKNIGSGDITVEQVQGEIEANNINGSVNLSGVSGSVVAHALNGNLKVTLLGIKPETPSSFSSMNGNIDVSLPADLKANVSLKTVHGEIYSGFDVKTDPKAIQKKIDESRSEKGKLDINVDGNVRGTINGGGPEFQFNTFNGNIYIRKVSE